MAEPAPVVLNVAYISTREGSPTETSTHGDKDISAGLHFLEPLVGTLLQLKAKARDRRATADASGRPAPRRPRAPAPGGPETQNRGIVW